MYSSAKSNPILSLRLVLAALMGLFVLVCFAQPAAPQVNIEIMVIDGADHVRVSWEEVEGAEGYNIYTSPVVNPEDWGDPIATVGDSVFTYTTEDSVDDLGRAYFFHVTAYAEDDIPDWLVLVDGDLYNGVVEIDPFLISKYQVTQEKYEAVMGVNPSHFADEDGVPNFENLPVEMVSWYDVIEYCNRLSISEGLEPVYSYLESGTDPDDWYGRHPDWNEDNANHTNVSADWEANGYRLPTEAEWHHAANAATHPAPYTYSGSDDIDEVGWYSGNSDIGDGQGLRTHPVGAKLPNGLGIYDMTGNVFEWCWDRYQDAWGSNSRVTRGGSWDFGANFATLAYRATRFNATVKVNRVGFRVFRNAP